MLGKMTEVWSKAVAGAWREDKFGKQKPINRRGTFSFQNSIV